MQQASLWRIPVVWVDSAKVLMAWTHLSLLDCCALVLRHAIFVLLAADKLTPVHLHTRITLCFSQGDHTAML